MKKTLVLLVASIVTLGLLVGCNSGGNEEDSDKTVIEVAVSGSAQELEVHQQKFDKYMEENPEVIIKPIDIGVDRVQKTMTLIGGGSAPDILYINEYAQVFAEKGVLLPLDDLIERDNFDLSVFYDSLIDPLMFEEQLYALPQEVSPFVIYYNKDMFTEAGVPIPTNEWTIEDFESAARQLTNTENKVYGYRHPGNWADQVTGWFTRAGASLEISGDELKGINTPEALEVLEFLYNFVVVDKLSPNPADLQAMGKGADAMFRNQKVAMESAGLWMLPQYKSDPLPFEWDVVRMPMDVNQGTKAGILNWGISKDSENIDVAWDLLKFMVGPEGMKIVAESNMALPGSKDEVANQIVIDSNFPDNVEAFIDSVEVVDFNDQKTPYRNEIIIQIQQIVDKMLIGSATPEETQKDLVEKISEIIDQ